MPDRSYKAALIGCGRVAWLLDEDPLVTHKPCSHAGAYREFERTQIIAAADTSAERAHAFSKEYGIDGIYLDYREMLEEARPDIVSICAYAPERFDMVCDSIKKGVKGIWCEKAFATSLTEADEMIRLCDEYNADLIVSHMRRWSSEYQFAKKLLSEGEIGTPISVVCHFSGSMIHTGTHAFDVLRLFFGDVDWVEGNLESDTVVSHHRAFGSTGDLVMRDTGGYALLFFRNGIYATIHGDTKGYFLFEFDIMGTKGRLRMGNGLFELYQSGKSKTESGLTELHRKKTSPKRRNNMWISAVEHLVDCMEEKAGNLSGPRDGRAALEIALAIHQSHNSGGERVHLPLENQTLRVVSR